MQIKTEAPIPPLSLPQDVKQLNSEDLFETDAYCSSGFHAKSTGPFVHLLNRDLRAPALYCTILRQKGSGFPNPAVNVWEMKVDNS